MHVDRSVQTNTQAKPARPEGRHRKRRLRRTIGGVKIAPIEYGDRKVYSVAAFNRGVADWLARLPTLWVEGEVTELRQHAGWQSVFFTLKDPSDGACLPVTMPRGRFEALRLDLVDVFGRPELYEARGDFRLRALSIERFGLGDHLAALERLKRKLAAEGLFAPERKRPLPRLPPAAGSRAPHSGRSAASAIASRSSATGSAERRRSPSSASGRRSRRARPGFVRCLRRRHSREGTRSSGRRPKS